MYYGKLLRQIAEAVRDLAADIQGGIEKVSSKIDAATAEREAKKDNSEPTPTIVGTLYRTQTEIDHEEAREAHKDARGTRAERRDRRRLILEAVALGLTAILVIANIGVLAFYVLQLNQMKIATEAAGQSADAAIAAADLQDIQMRQNRLTEARQEWLQMQSSRVSEASLQATQDQMRLDQRAWVGTVAERLNKELAQNEDVVISFNLANTGRTPAMDVELREQIAVGRFSGPNGEPPVPDWKKVTTVKGAIIFPNSMSGGLKETLDGSNITEGVFNAYKAPKSSIRIYLRIRVDYYDVFAQHHWIETCSMHKNGDAMDLFEQCSGGGVDPEPKR